MPLGVTDSLEKWSFQQTHVERNMDNAAYTAAHPDDTLVMAGPARWSEVVENEERDTANADAHVPLLPIGMVQQMSWDQRKPTQAMMSLGSGRSFFTSGKAQTSWSAARLWVNGRNLLRVLYHAAVNKNLDVSTMNDKAALESKAKHFINLDSELYHIPFGMAVVFRSKSHDWIGAFYAELCMINSWSTSVTAGQNQIMEQVSGMADRLLPIGLSTIGAAPAADRATVDKLIGFVAADAPAQGVSSVEASTTVGSIKTA